MSIRHPRSISTCTAASTVPSRTRNRLSVVRCRVRSTLGSSGPSDSSWWCGNARRRIGRGSPRSRYRKVTSASPIAGLRIRQPGPIQVYCVRNPVDMSDFRTSSTGRTTAGQHQLQRRAEAVYYEDLKPILAPFASRLGIVNYQLRITHEQRRDRLSVVIAVSDPAAIPEPASREVLAEL